MTAEVIYEGELRNTLVHSYSGNRVITDAPIDNQGKAEAFSPTDLVATACGACALTIMGIAARDRGFTIEGARVAVTKKMASSPRRISGVELHFVFPASTYTDDQKRLIEHIANNCPVMLSIHPDIEKEIRIRFG